MAPTNQFDLFGPEILGLGMVVSKEVTRYALTGTAIPAPTR
jgi:hypothetical protein